MNPVFAIAYGSVTIGTSTVYWWFFLTVTPGPTITPITVVTVPLDTHDIIAGSGQIYVVGRLNGNGQGLLWIF